MSIVQIVEVNGRVLIIDSDDLMDFKPGQWNQMFNSDICTSLGSIGGEWVQQLKLLFKPGAQGARWVSKTDPILLDVADPIPCPDDCTDNPETHRHYGV